MGRTGDEVQRDVAALVKESERLAEYAKELSRTAAEIRSTSASLLAELKNRQKSEGKAKP